MLPKHFLPPPHLLTSSYTFKRIFLPPPYLISSYASSPPGNWALQSKVTLIDNKWKSKFAIKHASLNEYVMHSLNEYEQFIYHLTTFQYCIDVELGISVVPGSQSN